MYLERLMWLCAALFILFGLPLAVIANRGWQKFCGGVSALSLAGFAFFMAGSSLVNGKIRLQNSWVNRATQPRSFWASIVLVFSAGIGVMIAAFWVLFFRI